MYLFFKSLNKSHVHERNEFSFYCKLFTNACQWNMNSLSQKANEFKHNRGICVLWFKPRTRNTIPTIHRPSYPADFTTLFPCIMKYSLNLEFHAYWDLLSPYFMLADTIIEPHNAIKSQRVRKIFSQRRTGTWGLLTTILMLYWLTYPEDDEKLSEYEVLYYTEYSCHYICSCA